MLGVCEWDQNIHVRVRLPLLERFLARSIPDRKVRDTVFVYLAVKTRNFVVGAWMNAGRTRFIDLLNMGGNPRGFSWEDGMHLRRMFGTGAMSAQDHKRAIWDEMTKKDRDLQDRAGDEADRMAAKGDTKVQVVVPG
jgi:hypothetical protein